MPFTAALPSEVLDLQHRGNERHSAPDSHVQRVQIVRIEQSALSRTPRIQMPSKSEGLPGSDKLQQRISLPTARQEEADLPVPLHLALRSLDPSQSHHTSQKHLLLIQAAGECKMSKLKLLARPCQPLISTRAGLQEVDALETSRQLPPLALQLTCRITQRSTNANARQKPYQGPRSRLLCHHSPLNCPLTQSKGQLYHASTQSTLTTLPWYW
jgi:hypothetical protein